MITRRTAYSPPCKCAGTKFIAVVVTEGDYIARLKSGWPQGRTASREVLSLAAEAVRDFPRSAMLWFLRGQLLTMAPADYIFSDLDAVCSFQQAIELDPTLADVCQEIAPDLDFGSKDPDKPIRPRRK